MSVRLIYKDIAVGADADASVSAPGAQSFSEPENLPFGVDTVPIATCELNSWGLGGTHKLLRDKKVGYWSLKMSGEDTKFETPPEITVSFDEQYTSLGIFLEFDTSVGDYCNDITINWYRGDTQLDSKDFEPDSASYFCENTVQAYNKIEILFNGTSLPYRYVKLSKIIFGVSRNFDIDELTQVYVLQEVDPISSELSINTMDWKLHSRDVVDYIFQKKQPVEAYDDETLIGVFYIDKSKRLASRIYEISCVDAIGVLNDSDFPARMLVNKNAAELILEILNGDFELDMDPTLEDEEVSGLLAAGTRREAIQQVAFAIGAIADTSGSSSVVVKPLPGPNDSAIPESEIYMGGDIDTESIVTSVKVTAHTYTEGAGSQGDDVVEVNGTKYVHTTSITTIENPAVTASDKQNVLEVKEATLVNPSNAQAVAQRVFDNAMRRNTLNSKIVVNGQKPGDYISMPTMIGTTMSGNILSMSMTMSGINAADISVKGA